MSAWAVGLDVQFRRSYKLHYIANKKMNSAIRRQKGTITGHLMFQAKNYIWGT